MPLSITLFGLKTLMWLIASFQRYWRSKSVQTSKCVQHGASDRQTKKLANFSFNRGCQFAHIYHCLSNEIFGSLGESRRNSESRKKLKLSPCMASPTRSTPSIIGKYSFLNCNELFNRIDIFKARRTFLLVPQKLSYLKNLLSNLRVTQKTLQRVKISKRMIWAQISLIWAA